MTRTVQCRRGHTYASPSAFARLETCPVCREPGVRWNIAGLYGPGQTIPPAVSLPRRPSVSSKPLR